MKLTWTGEHGAKVVAEKPDESMSRYFAQKFRDAWLAEADAFMQEVMVSMRKLDPGQTIEIVSKPIKVTIEKAADEDVVKARVDLPPKSESTL